jgi:hypothetical protein
MDPLMQNIVEYLESKGIPVEPKKSTFQLNVEMATILLTFMMAELDYMNARITALEGGGSNVE